MLESTRLPIVGVMGSGSNGHAELADQLGGLLASLWGPPVDRWREGVMTSVSQAFA